MISRKKLLQTVRAALQRSRVVALIGPRQCGKTTLARMIIKANSPNYFDLEDPASLGRLSEPMIALNDLKGVVVIDEVHRRPEIFSILRILADRQPTSARFLILGSATPQLLRQSSESLAGRLEVIEMGGFNLAELGEEHHGLHWLRGGLPLSYLAKDEKISWIWRKQFIQTFLERDVPQFGIRIPALTMLRFWTILSHYHGQIWNAEETARSLAMKGAAVRSYLDLLTGLFMIRQLQPWQANIKKRQVKAPKIYFTDSGLLHQLLGIHNQLELLTHPKTGASWEGYVINEALRLLEPDESFFWSTHQGAEIDLVMRKNTRLYGLEVKRGDAPRKTPSMQIAMDNLDLEKIVVIYPGERRYMISARMEAVPLREIIGGWDALFSEK